MGVRHLYPYNGGTPAPGGSAPVFGIGGYPTVSIQIVGTMAAGTYTPQVSNDGGQTWADIQVVSSGGTAASTIDAVGAYRVDANGFAAFRLLPDGSVTNDHVILMFASEEPFSRPGTGGGAASEVEVTSSVLPTGAATAARQDTGNTSLSGILTAVQIMDDWDESDRAKTNPIVGQAGISAGAGAVAANTPRVTHASDDPAVTALQIIDDWDESDRAKVNPIVGQAGVAGGSGTVGSTTQRVVLATDVGLPAGTNLLGRLSASSETSTIYNGTTALTPKFAVVSGSTSGNNTLVAAVASNKIRVISGLFMAAGTVNVTFQSGAGGTPITGALPLVANVGFTLPYDPTGHFETGVNTLLNMSLSAAVAVTGWIKYVEVP